VIRYAVRGSGMMPRYGYSGGSPVALGSTEPHEVWAKLVNPHRGLARTTELGINKNT